MKFINQEKIVRQLQAFVNMTMKKKTHYNILLISPAGYGKSTLAQLYFRDMNIEPSFALGSRFNPNSYSLENDPYLFIDEIHDLRQIETVYPYMDSPINTTVFCTTEYARLSGPFLSRCVILRFDEYDVEHTTEIILDYSRYLGFAIEIDTAKLIAERSRNNPRVAKINLMRAYGMMNTFRYEFSIDGFDKLFNEIGIYKEGFTKEDMAYIKFIKENGPIGLTTIARAINIDESTLKNIMEPYLIKNRIIEITGKGRNYIGNPFIETKKENPSG